MRVCECVCAGPTQEVGQCVRQEVIIDFIKRRISDSEYSSRSLWSNILEVESERHTTGGRVRKAHNGCCPGGKALIDYM